jgi:hypothetical protein
VGATRDDQDGLEPDRPVRAVKEPPYVVLDAAVVDCSVRLLDVAAFPQADTRTTMLACPAFVK